jgi:streptogramin lyase
MAVDYQGHPWIGTGLSENSSGVVSTFDGDVWRNYPLTDGLLCNHIACISVDPDNNKWIGFGYNGFGVTKYDGADWTNYSVEDGLASNNVNCIIPDSRGNTWFGTSNGVSKFDGSTWSIYNAENSNLLVNIFGIAEDHSGNLWFATMNGVAKYDGETWISYTNQDGLPGEAILSITVDKDDNIWVGSQNGGVSKFNGSLPWTTITADGLKLESDYVSTLKTDAQNNLWFAYGTEGSGVTKFNGIDWTHYHQNAGLINDNVTSLAPDAFDTKWIGTINGVSRFQGTTWKSYTTTDGLVGNFIRGIAIDNEGNKWFGTESGISKLEENPTLTVLQQALSVTCTNNSSASFDITSNITWNAISNQSWLTLSGTSGSGNGSITATAAFNPTETTRSAVITVSGSGVTSKTITVTQAATLLTVSQTELGIAVSDNSTASFIIASNIGWTVISDKSWLTLSAASGTNDGSITITGSANTNEITRSAIVTVSGNGISKTVTVTQTATTLTVSQTALEIAVSNNSTGSFTITSNVGWTIVSDKTWLSLSAASGTNNGSITVTGLVNANESPRSAIVTVTGNGISKTVTVTQAASVLTLSKTTIDIASAANSSSSFDITSNIGWNVVSDQTWLTLSGLSGLNNASITLIASINPDNTTRTAIITVSGTGVTSKIITVTQAATIPTGFKEISDPGIVLYPIPVTDKLNISIAEPVTKTSITLYNRGGIVIYTSTSTEGIKELDMSQYASGVYYIKIVTSDNKISIRKIIKR